METGQRTRDRAGLDVKIGDESVELPVDTHHFNRSKHRHYRLEGGLKGLRLRKLAEGNNDDRPPR